MKIHFIGANSGNVTGSRYLLEVNGLNLLLDCGLYQGHRKEAEKMNRELPFDPKKIDHLLLSHAHIDHAGNIPYLVKNGFKGQIIATSATKDLCFYMLADSAYIHEKDIEYLMKKGKCEEGECEPLYSIKDAEESMKFFQEIKYDEWKDLGNKVKILFQDAGHILGSATILIEWEENGETKILAYTGDLGRKDLAILKDPQQIKKADYLITESTYGDRYHEPMYEAEGKMVKIIKKAQEKGGKLIIPAFSLERTQEIIYELHLIWKREEVVRIPIYVDSPLAGNLTQVFRDHQECFDEAARKEFLEHAENPFGFSELTYTKSVEESKKLNEYHGPCIIISAAGMCENGRILHHLKNNIEDPKNTILIVSYMAQDTLGRKILEKQPIVKIFGEPYRLRAEVDKLNNFSGHADKSDLIDFIDHIDGLKKIFIVHGELEQQLPFKEALIENGCHNVFIPKLGDIEIV